MKDQHVPGLPALAVVELGSCGQCTHGILGVQHFADLVEVFLDLLKPQNLGTYELESPKHSARALGKSFRALYLKEIATSSFASAPSGILPSSNCSLGVVWHGIQSLEAFKRVPASLSLVMNFSFCLQIGPFQRHTALCRRRVDALNEPSLLPVGLRDQVERDQDYERGDDDIGVEEGVWPELLQGRQLPELTPQPLKSCY